jgi:hypothetical protein
MTCPTPCEETVCRGEQDVIDETLGVQVNETVTLVLFHPAEFADGDADAEIVGDVSSRLTVSQTCADELPCVSTACPQMD